MRYNITFNKRSKWAIINPVTMVADCFVSWSKSTIDSHYWALILMCSNGIYHHMPLNGIESMTELEPSDEDDELVIKLKDLLGKKYKTYENALEKQQNNGGAGIKTD